MERDYTDGVKNDVTFFVGTEIERTKHYGELTLFVVGVHSFEYVMDMLKLAEAKVGKTIQHIYLGANFTLPQFEYSDMAVLAPKIVDAGYKLTVDGDSVAQERLRESIPDHENVALIYSVKIPNVAHRSSQIVVKVDDIDFKATNDGVWCVDVNDMMIDKNITRWSEYKDDVVID